MKLSYEELLALPRPLRCVITADGDVDVLAARIGPSAISARIGANTVDTVNLRHMGRPLHVLVVNDHGYETRTVDHGDGNFQLTPVRALLPLNQLATQLYLANCLPDTTHQIVGAVAVVPDEDFAW